MKKVLSLALALVMMLTVCIPAFAADKTITTDGGSDDALVKTDISAVTGDGAFTVTFDSETVIPWGSSVDFTYKVTSQLKSGKCVKVDVAKKADEDKLTKDGVAEALEYTLTGDTSKTTNVALITDKSPMVCNLHIDVTNWTAAPIDEYTGHITYTATIVDIA